MSIVMYMHTVQHDALKHDAENVSCATLAVIARCMSIVMYMDTVQHDALKHDAENVSCAYIFMQMPKKRYILNFII